jgi:hypothetical protein
MSHASESASGRLVGGLRGVKYQRPERQEIFLVNKELTASRPGCGGLAVGSRKVELKVGDVLIVPPGVIHGWADIPDHVDYLSFRPSHGVMKNGWVNPTIVSK